MWILEVNIHSVKRIYSIAIIILLFQVAGFGQTNQLIDSLEEQLSKNIHDTTRVRALIRLADAYTFTDFQKSTQYAKEATDLAIKTEIPSLKYSANQQLALSYSLEGDFTSALKYETICLQLAFLLNDSTNIGLSHSNVGNYYYEIGEYDEAYYYLTQAYRILQRFSKTSADSLYMNIALHNVGRVFKELGQYEVALKHLRLSQKISEQIDDPEGKPYSLDEIGDVELRLGEYDSALHYLKLSLYEGKKIIASNSLTSIKELQPKTFSKIAKAYLYKGDYDKAFAYYDSTYKVHELTGNKFGIAEVELGRGTALLRQEKYDDAMRAIEKSVALAKEINARILQIACYKQLSILWEKKGNFKKSLEY